MESNFSIVNWEKDVGRVSLTDSSLEGILHALLREKLGVDVRLELAAPGETAPLTQIENRQKPIRLVDERG